MALSPFFPVALAASVGSGFAMWWALTDYERARYYPVLIAVPVILFATLGIFGIAGDQPPTLGQVAQAVGNPFGTTATLVRQKPQGIF